MHLSNIYSECLIFAVLGYKEEKVMCKERLIIRNIEINN